jgi:hypothetical protein
MNMRNRYGDEYRFDKVDENLYTITGDLKYWRYGGREGQERINFTDLGFVDPSGGPFISVGYAIEGRKVVRISVEGDLDTTSRIIFEVE